MPTTAETHNNSVMSSSLVPAMCRPIRQLLVAERRLAAIKELLRQLGDHKKAARSRKWASKVRRLEERIKQAKMKKERLQVDVAYWRTVAFIRQRPGDVILLDEWIETATSYLEPEGILAELRVKLSRVPALRMQLGHEFDEEIVPPIEAAIADYEERLVPFLKLVLTRLCANGLVTVASGKVFHGYPDL